MREPKFDIIVNGQRVSEKDLRELRLSFSKKPVPSFQLVLQYHTNGERSFPVDNGQLGESLVQAFLTEQQHAFPVDKERLSFLETRSELRKLKVNLEESGRKLTPDDTTRLLSYELRTKIYDLKKPTDVRNALNDLVARENNLLEKCKAEAPDKWLINKIDFLKEPDFVIQKKSEDLFVLHEVVNVTFRKKGVRE